MTRTTAGATTTDSTRPDGRVERYGRRARWYHAAIYTGSIVLLVTGWWLLAGREGDQSPMARLASTSDPSLHLGAGWVFAAISLGGAAIGLRAVRTFLAESLRSDRGDGLWFRRWPGAAFTGRFAHHRGSFDPGQRVANLVIALCLVALVVSGAGLALVHGGPSFVWFLRIHQWATYVLTPVVIGHMVIASGLLPGYRGVWRSMHFGGGVDADVRARVWPETVDREDR